MLLLFLNTLPTAWADPITVEVDPRVELISIVMRLAGAEEYTQATSGYAQAVDTWFAPHTSHRAVKLLRTLRKNQGISYDAPMTLAVHLDTQRLEPLLPLHPLPARLDTRWSPSSIEDFTRQLRRFSAQARFPEFLVSQEAYITAVEEHYRQFLSERDVVGWFDGFFGPQANAQYQLIPGLLAGPSNYGVSVERPDGSVAFTPILGVGREAAGIPVLDVDDELLLVHELAHAYLHPILTPAEESLRPAAEADNAHVAAAMAANAYEGWDTLLHETGVRAISYLYAKDRLSPEQAAEHLNDQMNKSFYWTSEVAAAFDAHRGAPVAALPQMGEVLARWGAAPWYPNFSGPINAAYQGWWRPGRMRVIAPRVEPATSTSGTSVNGTSASQQAADYVNTIHQKLFAKQGIPLVAAAEPLPTEPQALVLYGTPHSNPHLATMLERLGWKLDAAGIMLGEQHVPGEHLALIACAPHPDEPTLPILVYAAAHDGDLVGINRIHHGPTDWVVVQRTDTGKLEALAKGDFPQR